LLAQNQELKRLRKETERRKTEDEEVKEVEREDERVREVEAFERAQAGLGRVGGKRKREARFGDGIRSNGHGEERGEVKRSKADGEELPSFWVPSQIPDNQKADVKIVKAQPTCPAGSSKSQHPFTLKTLVTVKFTEDERSDANGSSANGTADGKVRTCPSCNKALSNATKAVLAKPCGHVLCKPCSEKFQRPPEKSAHDEEMDETVRCYVCQEDVTPGRKVKAKGGDGEDGKAKGEKSKVERGLVELSSEGTGFAGGGKNMVKKEGVAFQC
jgi:nitric oxide synthase-interacting protein